MYQTREFMPESHLDEINACFNCDRSEEPVINNKVNNSRIINIYVSARALPSNHVFDKGDPVCVLSLNGPSGNREYARTEVCWNSLEPTWIRPFSLEIAPDASERLVFEIYDVVNPSVSLESQKLMAVAQVELDSLLSSAEQHINLDLVNPKLFNSVGVLDINFFDVDAAACGAMLFKVNIKKIHSPARTIKSADPFFIIQRLNEKSSEFVSVYKSSVKEHKNHAEWPFVELNIQSICGGDLDFPIRVSLHDFLPRKANDLIGFFDTTLRRLTEVSEFEITNNIGKHVATFDVELVMKTETPRFFDFQTKGMKIQPILAVDFSSTYVDAVHSNRLQHVDSGEFSYQTAIADTYDSLKSIVQGQPYICYAFADFASAKVCPFKQNNQVMSSMKSLISSYKQTKENIQYPSHACLEPVIFQALADAKKHWADEKCVSLLLILTNGKFMDLQKAIDRLVESQNEPLITMFLMMDGMRPDLDQKLSKHHGRLIDSDGNKASRQLAHITIYHDEKIYPDHKLAPRILPIVKQMTVEYLKNNRMKDFY